jgi:hypothetical protein
VWTDQIDALGRVHRRWPGRALYRVGPGALLEGWTQHEGSTTIGCSDDGLRWTLNPDAWALALSAARSREPIRLADVDISPARDLIAAELPALAALCDAMLADRISIADLAALDAMVDGAPRVQPLADADIIDSHLVPEGIERGRYIYQALRRAVEMVQGEP